jgi:hypothetical protein
MHNSNRTLEETELGTSFPDGFYDKLIDTSRMIPLIGISDARSRSHPCLVQKRDDVIMLASINLFRWLVLLMLVKLGDYNYDDVMYARRHGLHLFSPALDLR